MFRITRETDYGILLLSHMAKVENQALSTSQLAEQTGLSSFTVSKILKLLTRCGLLISQRGAQGGYQLARPPHLINVADIIRALDGPIAITECADPVHNACGKDCGLSTHWLKINLAISHTLEKMTLTELSMPEFPITFHNHQVSP